MKYVIISLLALTTPALADWSYTIDNKQMIGFRLQLHITYTDGKRIVEENLSLNAEALEQLDNTLDIKIGELERIDRIINGEDALGKKITSIPDIQIEAVNPDIAIKP